MLTSLSKNALYRMGKTALWFLVLVGLPLTSFPILSRLTGAIVAPFSFIPLALLVGVWLLPYLIEKGKFPAEVLPFLYFVLVAVVVSCLAFFLNGYYDLGRDFLGQSLRAFITMAIGISFYMVFATYPRDEKGLRQVLLFIYIGAALIIAWGLLEVVLLRRYGSVRRLPSWFNQIRAKLAVQSINVWHSNRVSGMAYEPSWFVREFNLVLFPIWLAAIYLRKSLFKFRLWIFQVEDALMVGGLIVFGFSSPRVGLVAFLASLAYLALLLFGRVHGWLMGKIISRRKKPLKNPGWSKFVLGAMLVLILFVAAGGALLGYVVVASGWDERYQLLVDDSTISNLNLFPITEDSLIYFADELQFSERLVYWFGGWHTFNDHPFGVGLGNAGFYMIERMNSQGWMSPEIRDIVYRASYLPNTKYLWVRLLSETGFLGFAVFVVWLIILWRSASLTRKSDSKILQIVGLAGQLFLMAYLVEGLSMDSFAMPYQWLMAGLISAGGLLARKELKAKDKPEESQSAAA
ncbi:MAG: O-antigen ligase family protein [Anaerolineaceae bacterium]|nr:O-antigen ligase family protein [Anaerolineaceae bacterium]